MSKQTKTSWNLQAIKPSVWAVLRGFVFFLLFTHQAWANIVCCGLVQFEHQLSCHRNVLKQIPNAEQTAETSHCHATATEKTTSPEVTRSDNRFTNLPEELPWCCQAAAVAEPQPPISSSNEPTSLNAALVAVPLTAAVIPAPAKMLSPPPKSRPIFLSVSCLLI